MKNITKYIICFGSILIFGSCKKYLDVAPTEIITQADVYNNINNAIGVWANLYSYLPDEGYNWVSGTVTAACTDECKNHWENPSEAIFNSGSWSPTNNPLDNWARSYQGIRTANLFLTNIDNVPLLASQQSFYGPLIPVYKADARFVRAVLYFELFKRYGAVPLVNNIVDISDIKSTQLPRNPIDQVVSFITSECDAIAGVLPDSYASAPTQLGRITKGAALALKAKTLIYAASPLFNGNPLYANVKNADGTPLFDATYDKNKWLVAANAAKAVLDLGTYNLSSNNPANPVDNYAQLFFTREFNETILPRTEPDSRDFENNFLPSGKDAIGCQGNGRMSIFQTLVDAYEMNNGYPINASGSGYTTTGFWNGTLWDGLKNVTVANVSNMYKNRDPRFYATIMFQYDVWNYAANPRPIKYAWFGNNGGTASDGWPKIGTNCETGYGWRKWLAPQINKKVSSTGNASRNYPIIRLAEVYLWYAEAMNEYSGPSQSVYNAVNKVRNRVSMPGLPVAGVPSDVTQDGLRQRIQNEYRVEFALEGHRFWDVRRWLIAQTVDNGNMYGLNARPTTAELQATGLDVNSEAAGVAVFYQQRVNQTRVFLPKHYLMPIPQNEINKDPLLIQNYGW